MLTALRRCSAVAVTLAVAVAPLRATAQPDPSAPPAASAAADDPVAQASAHYVRGVKLYEEDDFRAALIEFNRAYELAPNWAVLYNLGQTHYQLREYPGALKTLDQYLREGGAGIAPDRWAQVEREITELRGRVARVTAVASVDGADVTLDDVPIGKTPSAEPVVVGEGRHRLTASKPGYVATTKVVDVAGGDEVTVRLDLSAGAQAVPLPPREAPSYTVAIVGGLVAVTGIAAGTVFGVVAMNDKAALKSECNDDKVCPSSAQGDIDAFSRNGAISTVAFGIGAAGLVLGGYFFFHERAKDTRPGASRQSSRATTFAPWIGPGAGGVAGTF
jgi:hypothetical protein